MDLHLFSSPGRAGIEDVVAACAACLRASARPVVTYLPGASADPARFLSFTREAFARLAELDFVDVDTATAASLRQRLDRAEVLLLPGGNTYLLASKFRDPDMASSLREAIRGGLAVVAFSAGAVYCGVSVATSNDVNEVGLDEEAGLGVCPFSLGVHYPVEEDARWERDRFLALSFARHRRPILALEDGAYLRVDGAGVRLERGRAWRLEPGRPREPLVVGDRLEAS